MPDDFTTMQNTFYNELVAALGLGGKPFQLLQPSPPLVTSANTAASNNAALWQYFNELPAYSLTGQYVASGGALFSSNYIHGLLDALSAPPSTLTTDVPADVLSDFETYVGNLTNPPGPSQYGQLFRNWAMLHAPTSANVGAADYSKMMLDTVSSAQLAAMPFDGDRQPTWSQTYADLIAQLADAPSVTLDISNQTQDSDVSSTWTQGGNSGFLGLWGGSSSSSSISQQFAQGSVAVSGSFEHATTFQAAPGSWFSSACMADAWANETGAPWTTDGTWAQYFDPQTGELARFVTALIVISGMNITVQSDVQLSTQDQEALRSNSSEGMWPFYSGGGSSGSNTSISHMDDSGLTISITSDSGVPIVIGALVLSVDEFTGHAVEAAQAQRAASAAMAS